MSAEQFSSTKQSLAWQGKSVLHPILSFLTLCLCSMNDHCWYIPFCSRCIPKHKFLFWRTVKLIFNFKTFNGQTTSLVSDLKQTCDHHVLCFLSCSEEKGFLDDIVMLDNFATPPLLYVKLEQANGSSQI